MRNEIFVEDGLLFLNNRMIVPSKMRQKILKQLHESHFGVTKTKKRAKDALYWPGLDEDIENMIGSCHTFHKLTHIKIRKNL